MSTLNLQNAYAVLSPSDWNLLKNFVLDASRGTRPPEVPDRLRSHEAAVCLEEFTRTRNKASLNRAARALYPLYPEKAWLALEKIWCPIDALLARLGAAMHFCFRLGLGRFSMHVAH